jgi:alpha-L-fucosidase 2
MRTLGFGLILTIFLPGPLTYAPGNHCGSVENQIIDNPLPLPVKGEQADIEHSAVTTKPLTEWTSGFLTGNGNMGVIMRGNPYNETLIINGKLYLPAGSKEVLPDLSPFKDEFRKAGLAAGMNGPDTVHKLMLAKTGHVLVNTDPFHPAFFLRLGMKRKSSVFSNYRMTEDFKTGELKARWSDSQGDWSRKLFVSRKDNVIVMLISGPKGKVDYNISMEVKHELVKSELSVERGWISSHNTYIKGKGGYDNLIRVVPIGGTISCKDSILSVTGADNILLVMQVKGWKTPLNKDQSEAWAFSSENPYFKSGYTTNQLPEMKKSLDLLQTDYDKLFAPHVMAHGALYNRISIDLGGAEDRLLTSEELLERSAREGTMSKALAERLYNACRYLIICSTGDTPPNLQGIWTGTWSPAWSGDYTLDSNIQLEVQSMMSCNMPELMKSYFDLVDSWIPDCRLNAKKIFGFRGVTSNARASNTCLLLHWGKEWPGEQASVGLAGWMLHFYYDYFSFTGDKKFLRERFLPLAKGIALFYEDFLTGTEDANGKYRFYMGYSPEHWLYANTTFDISVAKNVLSTLIAASKELGVEQENLSKWHTMLDKMPPYLINEAGELKEWSWPGVGEDYNQRHHSHFLPLYQFCEFDRYRTPELWNAAGLAFDQKVKNWLRMENGSNSNHITHGMMNEGQCAARLGRSDVIYEILSRMTTKQYVYPGFMISYWPNLKGFGFDPVGTIPDVLNNSLIFGWNNTVDILPALPAEWTKGSISGVLLRGQIHVKQLAWDIHAGRINLSLLSDKDQTITLQLPPRVTILSAREKDQSGSIQPHKIRPNCSTLLLAKGKEANVEITFEPADFITLNQYKFSGK